MEWVLGMYPDVRHVSTETLSSLLTEPGQPVLLLDTRSEPEFRVSHLPGAVHVDPDMYPERIAAVVEELVESKAKELAAAEKDLQVVCYCAVGVRSSKVANLLQKRLGKDCFWNLQGSAFKWANEGRDLVDDSGEKTVFCHPYNSLFGLILKAELRKYP